MGIGMFARCHFQAVKKEDDCQIWKSKNKLPNLTRESDRCKAGALA